MSKRKGRRAYAVKGLDKQPRLKAPVVIREAAPTVEDYEAYLKFLEMFFKDVPEKPYDIQ